MTKYRVLIVDDSRFMRQVLCDVVNGDPSFTVISTAGDGEEAVRLVEQLEPDIVTMDMEMPRMNGLEALQRIMAVRSIPIIMLSAVTDNGRRDTIKALQYGAFDFVRKPDSSINLPIREVCNYLLEKLRAAADTIRQGKMHMLPAVEEASSMQASPPIEEAEPPKPPVPEPKREPPKPRPAPPAPARSGKADKAVSTAGPAPPSIIGTDSGDPAPRLPIRAAPAPAAKVKKTEKDAKSQAAKAPEASGKITAPLTILHRRSLPLQRSEEPPPKPPQSGQGQSAKTHASSVFHQVVAIGTSTGGPRALHEVLTKLPADFPAPVLIVQHMPPKFTHSLAQRLDSFCNIRVREAAHDDLLQTATAYIAPGGYHMTIARDQTGAWRIKISTEPLRNGHRPSVDVLFESLVGLNELERHIVLMTGMGSDGAKGMKALQQDGVQTLIAESEETCVVYGMPRSAVDLGAVHQELPLGQIGPALVREVALRSKKSRT